MEDRLGGPAAREPAGGFRGGCARSRTSGSRSKTAAPGGADLAAGGRGGEPGAGDPRVPPLPQARRHGRARRADHPYFAGHGYACVRVDMRGTGDSEGLLDDEYPPQEQDDALEVIAWLAAQPWCTGAVGMIGISWGGFNALQVAARRPPALKAIVTHLLDRRPLRRRHPLHGRLPAHRQPRLGVGHARLRSRPPDPALVGERWREMWLERLEQPRCSSTSGCATSGATPSGSTARSARTTPRSNARSTPSAAGPTATPTRSRACSPAPTCPQKG